MIFDRLGNDSSPWQFEHSREIHAERLFVWSFWTDVTNWEKIEGKAVEWIKLHGPFAEGVKGETKMPGMDPHYWWVREIMPGYSATIEMPLDGAIFYNRIVLASLSPDRTLMTQTMSLAGDKAEGFVPGMKVFEENAPQALAKMAQAMEEAYTKRD